MNSTAFYGACAMCAFAFASTAWSDAYYACAHETNGKLRAVTAPGQCHDTEYEMSWSGGPELQQQINSLIGRVTAIENALGEINEAPTVYAGPDKTTLVSIPLMLEGQATDDGLLMPLEFSWSETPDSGTVNFSAPTNLITSVSFSNAGEYALELSVFDGGIHVADSVMVTVFEDNLPPVVDAGIDVEVVGEWRGISYPYWNPDMHLSCEVQMSGSVSDDGLPLPVTFDWSLAGIIPNGGESPYDNYHNILVRNPDALDSWITVKSDTYARAGLGGQGTDKPWSVDFEIELSVNDGFFTETDAVVVRCLNPDQL